MTISGTNFDSTATNDSVKFNVAYAPPISATATTISAKVPTNATSGHLSVGTPAGKAVTSSYFFIPPSPYQVSDVAFTGQVSFPGATTVPVASASTIELLVFDGVQGQRLSMIAAGSTSGACGGIAGVFKVSIFNPNGSTLIPETGNCGGALSGPVTLTMTGTYTVLIASGGPVGNMSITLYNDPPDFAGTIVAGGATVPMSLSAPGMTGSLTFNGTQNQVVSLDVSLNYTGPCGGIAGVFAVSILRPDGLTLSSFGTCGSFYVDRTTLPITGTYKIVVDPPNGITPNINITLYNVLDFHGTIPVNGSATPVPISIPGQSGYMTFSGTAGQQVSLNISAAMSGCCLTVSILNPDLSTLTTTRAQTTQYLDATTLPTTGTYTILLDPDSNSIGTITLNLYNATTTTGTIVAGGSPVTAHIAAPGQNAAFTFSATAGQRVSLQADQNGITSTAYVSIQNPALPALTAGQNYDVRMEYFQNGSGSLAALKWLSLSTPKQIIPQTQLTPPGGAAGTGLKGDYYDEITLSGGPNLTRTDATVNFNWNGGSPGGSLSGSNFSARWTGQVQAQYSEQYTFCTNTDDGTRLWVNGYLVIDHWANQDATEWCSSTPTNLAAPLGIGPGGGFIDTVTIPITGTYTVYVNPQDTGTGDIRLTLIAVPADVTATITPGGFSVPLSTNVAGQNGTLTFSGTAGQRVSLQATGTPTFSNLSIVNPLIPALVAGQQYNVEMDYFVGGSGSDAYLKWYSPSTLEQIIPQSQLTPPGGTTGTGLKGDYFANTTLSGSSGLTRTDPTVNFNWNGSSPGGSIPASNWSARWTGTITPQYSEQYGFCTQSHDGARLWVNGYPVVDHFAYQNDTEWCSDKPTNLAPQVGLWTGGQFIDTVTLPVTGVYTIVLDPQGTGTASVTFTLNNVPADASSSATINGGSTTLGTNTPGQNAQVTFSGTASQLATVHITNNGMSCVTVSLLPVGGGTALTSTTQCGSSFNLSQQTLPTTGTYSISIDPNGANYGNITVAVTSP